MSNIISQLDFYDFVRDCKEIDINYFDEKEFGIVKVYAQDDHPVIFLKEVEQFDNKTLKNITDIQHICWNFQKVLFLYVYSNTEIRIYNCSERPFGYNKGNEKFDFKSKLKELEVFTCKETDKGKLHTLNTIFSRIGIDTGFIWSSEVAHDLRKKLTQQNRVDKYLIKSLVNVAKELEKLGLTNKELIHKLVMRSLFLLYLEDRGATSSDFYEQFALDAKSYFDILEEPNYTYELFKKLAEDFNGSLFTVQDDEKQIVTYEHLQLIKNCFTNGNVSNEQVDLFPDWRLFNFSIIRIELLSEIYENFLNELDKKETGTYYTPPSLVELILNEKLPANSIYYNVKTLDPSCGSGIFLVQSFKRLVKRYEKKHKLKQLTDFTTLVEILKNNIYGIEIDEKSIKVAAFSLYLALLDNLNPKTGWWDKTIQFPYLINDPKEHDLKEQGNNLFRRDTISDLSDIDELQNFQLVIGNPPFGTKKLSQSISDYCNENHFAKEMVLPFLHKATHFAPNGEISLIFNTKILTNTSGTYQNFRRWLFTKNYVEKIYNFSILRKAKKNFGGQLFGSAVEPISVLFYQKEDPKDSKDMILYYAPKTYIKNDVLEGIVIDESDVKHLPRIECEKPNSKIWKIAMWGSYFDFELIKKYERNSLKKYFKNNTNWIKGTGLHIPSKNYTNKENIVTPKKIIDTTKISRYLVLKDNLKNNKTYYLKINEHLTKAPFLVIKKGITKGTILASFVDFDAYFLNRVYGLKTDDVESLKILLSYFNSTFAKYFQFNYSSAWGLKYDDVLDNELYALPNIFDFLNYEIKQRILILIDEIISIKKIDEENGTKTNILHIEKEIDQIIYNDILKLTKDEQIIIQDTLDYSLDLFEKQENSDAVKPVSKINKYIIQLTTELNNWLEDVDLKISTTVYEINRNCPLYMVKISFGSEAKQTVFSQEDIYKELKTLDKKLIDEKTPGLYFIKKLNYYDGDDVYIIKPNQRRFWSQTAAMEDCRNLLAEILKMK